MIACLENLVGVTAKECDCIDGTKPANFSTLNASTSGYYIDEFLDVRQEVFAALECEKNVDLFTKIAGIRDAAQKKMQTDLQAALLSFYTKRVTPFKGEIGQRLANRDQQIPNRYNGMTLCPQRLRDAKLTLTGLFVGFNQGIANDAASQFDVTIASNNPDWTTQTVTVNRVAGVFNKFVFTTPLELPFHSPVCYDEHGLQYYIYYDKNDLGTASPLQNKLYCCGSRPEWLTHITAGGFSVNTIEEMKCCSNEWAYGLVLEGYVTCDNLEWICNLPELNGLDFQDVIARTIQAKATVDLAQFILDSNNINQYTILNREQLYGKRSKYTKEYSNLIHWIATNVNDQLYSLTGCYKCKQNGAVVNL